MTPSTPCTALSDRMPEIASGRSHWTEEEERHLASCAECRAEWAVVRAVQNLGTSLPGPAAPTVVVARVRERLAAEHARKRIRARMFLGTGLAAAAALALVVRPWRSEPEPAPTPVPVASAPSPGHPSGDTAVVATAQSASAAGELPIPELDSLPVEALDSILHVLDEPFASAGGDDAPLDDGGDGALARALSGLEG